MDRRRGDVVGFSGGGFGGGIHHVHDRVVFAGADVQDRRPGSLPPERQSNRTGHVGNVGEVAALAAVAVDDDRLARLDPAAEGFQSKVGTLAFLSWQESQTEKNRRARKRRPCWRA